MKIHFNRTIGSLLTAFAMCFALGSCSTDDALDATQAVTHNADGTLTIRALTNVALPGGFTQATLTGATASRSDVNSLTGEDIANKTSWKVGDRLHIKYSNSDRTKTFYRYATLQADGTTWLLNDGMTITDSNFDSLEMFYFGSNYNTVDFNDPNSGPTGKSYLGESYNNSTANYRLFNHLDNICAKTHEDANGYGSCYDVLLTDNYSMKFSSEGIISISMRHTTARIAITSADVSAFGSNVTVSSIVANTIDYRDSNIKYKYLLAPVSGTEQPSATQPWSVYITPNPLISFTVTLSDGRQLTASVSRYEIYSTKIYAYRLILGPGNATATPDASFTAPGWTAGTVTVSGLASDITPIYDRAGLEAIKNKLSGKYILMNDIDLSGSDWTPIGTHGHEGFAGHLDGNGHTISNLKVSDMVKTGLFDMISETGIVYNLHFDKAAITGKTSSSSVMANVNKGIISNCSVTNSTVTGNKNSDSSILVAENYGTITHCHATNCSVSGVYTFGLVNHNINGNIIACYTKDCTITGSTSSTGFLYENTGKVLGCYAVNNTLTPSNGYVLIPNNGGIIYSCYGTNAIGQILSLSNPSSQLVNYNCVDSYPIPTNWSALVAVDIVLPIPTVVRAADGTLSTVSRIWRAAGIWGKAIGTPITITDGAPQIVWSYNGEVQ